MTRLATRSEVLTARPYRRPRYLCFPSRYLSILNSESPCVFLHTLRPDEENQRSYLFIRPIDTVCISDVQDIGRLFESIQNYLARGLFVAGFLGYECGYDLNSLRSFVPPTSDPLLAWFGAYRTPFIFNHTAGRFDGRAPREFLPRRNGTPATACSISNCRLAIPLSAYCSKIEAIRNYIAAGDTYQVNFTTRVLFDFAGSLLALYAALGKTQSVPYAAYLHFGDKHVLCFSPELFFRVSGGRIITRPMKGTARRGRHAIEDRQLASWLQNDPKNRAENVMIVDLLRNDLGRISEIGSVQVDSLFAIERYETLLQMTSTVSGKLKPGLLPHDIFQSIFRVRLSDRRSENTNHANHSRTGRAASGNLHRCNWVLLARWGHEFQCGYTYCHSSRRRRRNGRSWRHHL